MKTRLALYKELALRGRSAAVGQIALVAIIGWFTHRFDLFAISILITALARIWVVSRRVFSARAFAVLTLTGAAAWGLLSLEMLRTFGLNHLHTHLTLLTLAGLSAAAASSLSPAPWLFFAFTGLVLGTPCAYLVATAQGEVELGIPILFACFAVFLASQVRAQFRQNLRSITHHDHISRERDRLQTVLNTFPGFVSCVDDEARYEFVNSAYREIFGKTPEIGAQVGDSGREPEFATAVRHFVQGEEHRRSVEFELETAAGPRTFLVSMQKIDTLTTPGSRPGAVIVSLDVTARIDSARQLEEERARSQFAAKMALLGEMAAGVAHEINNPLAVIGGHADQLKMSVEAGRADADRTLRSAEKIRVMVARISKIVRGLRTFARSGEGDPMSSVTVGSVIDDTLELCAEKIRHAGITLTVSPHDNFALECSPTQISQVLLNLISNARDAVENLPEKWIRIEAVAYQGFARITVTDSGTGIPEKIRDRILVPFFTTKPIGRGTGLGLSISRGICESHQGVLTVDGESPHTSFIVLLPLKQAVRASAA